MIPVPHVPRGYRAAKQQTTNLNDTLRSFRPKSAPALGALVDLSIRQEYRSQYQTDRNPYRRQQPLTAQVWSQRINREFNKISSEMRNLERHIQKQDWYQELKDVFPATSRTNANMEKIRCKQQLQTLSDIEAARKERGLQKLQHLQQTSDQQALQNLKKIQGMRREKELQQLRQIQSMV